MGIKTCIEMDAFLSASVDGLIVKDPVILSTTIWAKVRVCHFFLNSLIKVSSKG